MLPCLLCWNTDYPTCERTPVTQFLFASFPPNIWVSVKTSSSISRYTHAHTPMRSFESIFGIDAMLWAFFMCVFAGHRMVWRSEASFVGTSVPSFHPVNQGSDSGSHAYAASTLCTGPSQQLPYYSPSLCIWPFKGLLPSHCSPDSLYPCLPCHPFCPHF